jgi:hypothetical protein
LQLRERSKDFVRSHDETLAVAMRIHNPKHAAFAFYTDYGKYPVTATGSNTCYGWQEW